MIFYARKLVKEKKEKTKKKNEMKSRKRETWNWLMMGKFLGGGTMVRFMKFNI